MAGRWKKARRCHFYNSRGQPRSPSQLCSNHNEPERCRFAHPSDSQWIRAEIVLPPAHFGLPRTPEHSLSPRASAMDSRRRSHSRSVEPRRGRSRDKDWSSGRQRTRSPTYPDRRGRSPVRSRERDRDGGRSKGRYRASSRPRRDYSPARTPPHRSDPSENRMSIDKGSKATSTNTTPLGNPRRTPAAVSTPAAISHPNSHDTTPKTSLTRSKPGESPATTPRAPAAQQSSQQQIVESIAATKSATPDTTTPASAPPPSIPVMQPPTLPELPPPLPAPPALPPPISAAAARNTPSLVPPLGPEPSREERYKLWDTRTKKVAKHSAHKTELKRVEQQINELQALTNFFTPSTPTDIYKKLQSLRARRDKEKAAMEAALKDLVESNSWPMGDPAKSSKEIEAERKKEECIRELLRLTESLNLSIAKVDELVRSHGVQEQTTGKEDRMDVDDKQEGPSSRPLKRRRLSNDAVEPMGSSAPALGPSMEDILTMEKTIHELEDKMQTLENDLAIQSHDFQQEIHSILDPNSEEYAYLDDLPTPVPATDDMEAQVPSPAPGDGKIVRMRSMQRTIDQMDADIRELGDAAADIINKQSVQDEAIRKVEAENQSFAAELVALQDRLQALESKRETDTQQIRTMEAALSAYKESVLNSPPASPAPTVPSFDHVFPLIEEKVIDAMQEAVRERGAAIRTQLEEKQRTNDAKLFNSIWDPLMTTARLIQVVASRVQLDPNPPP
ncbi:hypothetical protein Moror_6562 [Moniliophthora roreri MCA 2997]|uniref:C3H1-type domain-containing protein n=2 Tax=Moniliophthora roreri TaxID=221103 RepID=V2YZ46_MONRO|nr:hypothetical protein Moror_6562 [Moniliophthora roreri MCA 2997]KAI3610806.1 hypothetical protein WG66_006989 [Moniliophthora roreri]